MKRIIVLLALSALMLGGCATAQEDPFLVDTVIRIPVDPTEAPTEPPETQTQTTEPPAVETEAATVPPTQPKAAEPKKQSSSSSGKSNSSKGSSSSSKNQTSTKAEPTAAPETEPPVTAPPPPPPTEAPYDPSSYDVGSLENGILDELNAYRAGEGEGELSISGKLSGIAALRAREGKRSWSHTRPDGRSYTSALSDYGYGYSDVAELMVYVSGSGDAGAIAAKWLGSDSHSANIRSSSFSKAGIGIYRSGGVTYVVCLLVG